MSERKQKLIAEASALWNYYKQNERTNAVRMYAEDFDYLVGQGAIIGDRLEGEILVERGEPKAKRYSKRPPSAPGQV